MVRKTILAMRSNYGAKRSISKIKWIVVHYTANDGDRDESNANYFHNNKVGASAHAFADDDSVTTSVPDEYVAYSVGGSRYSDYKKTGGAKFYGKVTNANSLSIEMCDTVKNGTIQATEATMNNAVIIIREWMDKYGIDIDHVVRHFDVNGKHCPAYLMSEAAWADFKRRIMGTTTAPIGFDWSPVFDATYYANRYPDLRAAGLTTSAQLLNHFINNGMKEKRQANDVFNVDVYRNRYADLRLAFGEDYPAYYKHFCTNGKLEGRKAI